MRPGSLRSSRDWPRAGALAREGSRVWHVWSETGGLWRWAGVLLLTVSAAGVRSMRIVPEKKAEGRNLNWNR
ncbi:MAG: hypothetical protein A2506_13830 [Elusimicrobia bacterium RIFOXYD12_FULL_66_9]|nr:MAG: hypothetical protein A2506_13830 [Elusimicrobia bacterium RIFOXYD12_FULL_66_9]